MSLYRLLIFEIRKLFKDRTAHAGFILTAVVCILFSLLNYLNRPSDAYSGIGIIMDNIHIQTSVLFTLPLLAVFLAVHSLSEEFSSGTLRTLMTRPLKRENILISKALALFIYMFLSYCIVLVISLLFGFKWGFPENFISFVPRLLSICFIYALFTLVLVAFTLMVASFGTPPVLTTITAFGFYLTCILLELFVTIRGITFTYNTSQIIQLLLGPSINARTLFQSLAAILIYILGLLLVASILWERRDVAA